MAAATPLMVQDRATTTARAGHRLDAGTAPPSRAATVIAALVRGREAVMADRAGQAVMLGALSLASFLVVFGLQPAHGKTDRGV